MYSDIFDNIRFTYPVTTTTKSMMFQTLRRYEPRCNMKPNATIFSKASTQNIIKKYNSVFSCKYKIKK